MIEDLNSDVAAIGIRLLDDAHFAWFSAERQSERALHAWFNGTGSDRNSAYVAYRAALDREDAAAHDLQRLWQVAEPCRQAIANGRSGVRQ